MYNEKCYFIFSQILSYVEKLKVLTLARMKIFIKDKNRKIKFHIFFFHIFALTKFTNLPDRCPTLKGVVGVKNA
jgi:hypothetical protein